MALEVATYLDGLVATNPAGSDPLAQADDHIRLIKSVLKNTFPNITGQVAATQGDLNNALPKTGGTMTGALVLSTSSPSTALEAASKGYVDGKVAASTSGLSDPGSNGMLARTAAGATAARTLTAGAGISITNGNGLSGNPTISNTGVTSVNGQTGAVTVSGGVTSVDGATGAVDLSALSSFAKSHAANGYQKLPGGLIIAWGTVSRSGTTTSVTFSPAFTTVYSVNVSGVNAGSTGGTNDYPVLTTVSATGFTISSPSSQSTYHWMAIGK